MAMTENPLLNTDNWLALVVFIGAVGGVSAAVVKWLKTCIQTELNSFAAKLHIDLTAQKATIEDLVRDHTTLSTQVASNKAQAEIAIGNIRAKLEQKSEDLAALKANHHMLKEGMSRIETKVDNAVDRLERAISNRFDQVCESIREISKRETK